MSEWRTQAHLKIEHDYTTALRDLMTPEQREAERRNRPIVVARWIENERLRLGVMQERLIEQEAFADAYAPGWRSAL